MKEGKRSSEFKAFCASIVAAVGLAVGSMTAEEAQAAAKWDWANVAQAAVASMYILGRSWVKVRGESSDAVSGDVLERYQEFRARTVRELRSELRRASDAVLDLERKLQAIEKTDGVTPLEQGDLE